MKAVIPVAGIGTRLRPHTHTQPKALVPVAGKPILGHIIDSLIKGGVHDFIFIIGYLGNKIEEYITSQYIDNALIKADFVIQEPRKGTAHALLFAKDLLKEEEEFLVMLGDTVITVDLEAFIASENSVLGVKKVDRPGMFGVVELNTEGQVKRLIEKPKIPKSNLALVGIYKINDAALFIEAIDWLIKEENIKTHGEYQLTDALMYMVEKGHKITVQNVENWYDCGKKESLLEANAILLNDPKYHDIAHSFEKTIIIPPVSIGENCTIKNSIIGPNVAIGDNALVSSSIIKNTIIGAYSELKNAVLHESIIGNDSSMIGLTESLNIGDNTEINFMGEQNESDS